MIKKYKSLQSKDYYDAYICSVSVFHGVQLKGTQHYSHSSLIHHKIKIVQ